MIKLSTDKKSTLLYRTGGLPDYGAIKKEPTVRTLFCTACEAVFSHPSKVVKKCEACRFLKVNKVDKIVFSQEIFESFSINASKTRLRRKAEKVLKKTSWLKDLYTYLYVDPKKTEFVPIDEVEKFKFLANADRMSLSCSESSPINDVLRDELYGMLHEMVRELTEREEATIRMRVGLSPYYIDYTIDEIAAELSITRGRVRQLEGAAIRKLKTSLLSKRTRKYIESDFYEGAYQRNSRINQYNTPEKEITWSTPTLDTTEHILPTEFQRRLKNYLTLGGGESVEYASRKAYLKELNIQRVFDNGGKVEILTIEDNGSPSSVIVVLEEEFLHSIRNTDALFLKKLALSYDRIISRSWLEHFISDLTAA